MGVSCTLKTNFFEHCTGANIFSIILNKHKKMENTRVGILSRTTVFVFESMVCLL